jgi:hypothetical protein
MNDSNHFNSKAKIWNPQAAARWSILFTPIFGAILQMKNWQSLGQAQKARQSFYWALGVATVIIFTFILTLLFPESGEARAAASYAPWLSLAFWQVLDAGKQSRYVKAELKGDYDKRGWSKPLTISSTIVLTWFIGFFMLTSDDADSGFKEGSTLGKSSDLSVCYQTSLNRMNTCSGFKCEVHELSFAKGCAKTANVDQAFCESHPSSIIDSAVEINSVCKQTKFSEKGCLKSLNTYLAKCRGPNQ